MSNGESILKPNSAGDVADIVRAAAADRAKLRTARLSASEELAANHRLLDLSGMSAVVDYPARDMTITVQAGMPANELSRILANERQQLPIDCFDRAMSVGAMVASDVAGSRQYGYGTLRDYVIGIEAVDGQGRVFHAGGRVVKNVAGYDLCRLMVGSRGSLAVITQVTFKLKPVPEQSLIRSFHFPRLESFSAALDRINVSAATPVVLDFAAAPATKADERGPVSLTVGVEGSDSVCDWQAEQIRGECGSDATQTFDSRDAGTRGDAAPEFRIPEHCRGFGYGWKSDHYRVAVLPSKLSNITKAITDAGHHVVGHAGNGILYAIASKQDSQLHQLCEQLTTRCGGSVSTWESSHPARQTDPLSTRLRQTFDPHGLFDGSGEK
ncbi:MAG: FAD-binding oxidoreductase [Planctomycetaceae bacterium]